MLSGPSQGFEWTQIPSWGCRSSVEQAFDVIDIGGGDGRGAAVSSDCCQGGGCHVSVDDGRAMV